MNQLIQVINRLQDVWSCIGAVPIELPQLVVVGSQSSGKSSVLENIVGRDLLPRGGGIVTRRPLILQLVNTMQVESELYPPDDAGADDQHTAAGAAAAARGGSRPNDTDTESNSGDHGADHAAARRARDAKAADVKGAKDSKKDDAAAARGAKHQYSASSSSNGQGAEAKGASAGASSALGSTQSSGGGGDTDSTAGEVEWGEFGHKKGVRYYDFEEIRDEISKETDRVVGSKKNISAQPITLKVFSPHVLNLTLVDLPGITKVPVGDQPSDIEKQIRDMIWTYISSPASIIVAVTPANMDLANSDALKLAREADPQGVRTIGVLTKLDLMDKGTDALDVLTGKVISLQHGFIGVVNRSQLDINQKKSIRQSLAAERQFFMQHAVYRPIANRCGTAFLARRLNAVLMHHIQESLPDMRVRIAHNIAETQEELESYGNPLLNSPTNLGPLLLHLLSKFCNNYCDALEGKSPDVSITQLYGGARISYIFHDVFCKRLDNINPFDELTDQDIRTAIRNATGPRPSLFIPEISFELLVKRQIERLQAPSLQCVDLVFDELKRVASQCESLVSELQRFPVLRENVYDCVRSLLERRLRPTKTMINNLVHIELAYINTNHPDFIGGSKAVASLMDRMAAMSAQAKAGMAPGAAGASAAGAGAGNNKPQAKESPVNKSKPMSPPVDGGAAMPGPLRLIGRDDQKFGGRKPQPQPQHSDDGKTSLVPAGGRSAFADDVAYDAKPAVGRGRLRDLHLEDPKPAPAPGLHRPIQSIPTPLPTDRELIETEIIKSLISSYFNIVRKTIQDAVPKAIMYFLVNHSKQDIQSELVRTLYKENLFEGLLKEADDVSQKRLQCVEHLRTMRKALDIVNSVRDYNPLTTV